MLTWVLLAVVLVVLGALALLVELLKGTKGERPRRVGDVAGEAMPYRRVEGLLTKGEAAFYHVLRHVVEVEGGREGDGGGGGEGARGPRRVVMAKVRLLDLVEVPRGTEKWRAWQSRVQSKHVDFVVCEGEGVLRPVMVVELDDRSHDREDRKERDGFVDRVLEGAGVRVVRVRAKRGGYEVGEVRGAVFGRTGPAAV